MHSSAKAAVFAAALLAAWTGAASAQSSSAKALYDEAQRREAILRRELDAARSGTATGQLLTRIRTLVQSYEDMARLFPRSAYSDNALWEGARLSADAFWHFGDAADRLAAIELLELLRELFPSSSFVKEAVPLLARLRAARAAGAATAGEPAPPSGAPRPAGSSSVPAAAISSAVSATPATSAAPAILRAIWRDVLPEALRVTLEFDHEVAFDHERLENPARVLVDLRGARPAPSLRDATLPYDTDIVRRIRVGRPEEGRTRVVLDLEGAGRYSVYWLYNPYRLVIDFERSPAPPTAVGRAGAERRTAPDRRPPASPHAARSSATAPPAPPRPPAANAGGGFSLSRQLGLGASRIVIDPGHGGRDPGAKSRDLTEAELVLDVALRLEKLLLEHPGIEVVLTRRDDTYLSLEERTALANRVEADIFLSIHANASAAAGVRGVETYFLDFAATPAAEAIAVRENAASAQAMRSLPDIVRAIALNNKIDESRDLAAVIQSSLYQGLRRIDSTVRNLGVKQAPFMVLVGATMPGVLTEISFITHRQEAALLKTDRYRQRIAESLHDGIMRYQDSLKRVRAVAAH